MARQTWTTPEQKDWLESKRAAFLEAKQKGNLALKEHFLTIFKDFREKWPVPPVLKRNPPKRDQVHWPQKKKGIDMTEYSFIIYSKLLSLTLVDNSMCENGFTTIPVFSLPTQDPAEVS